MAGVNADAGARTEQNSYPTFTDVDEDGRLDLVIGGGLSIRYWWQCPDGTFAERTGAQNPFDGIKGIRTSPHYFHPLMPKFIDLDSDGDLDLVLVDLGGRIKYFKREENITYTHVQK